jgi:hypothetical protein
MAAVRAARVDLQASIALIAPDERETLPVCGHWTLKDVVGHVADWCHYFHGCLSLMLGEQPPSDWSPDIGEEANEERVAIRRHQSWMTAWVDFNARHLALRDAINALEESELNQSQGNDAPYHTIYACAWSSLEHDLDHAATLRRELGVPMPDYLLHVEGPFA